MVHAAFRVPLSVVRNHQLRRHRAGAAAGAGALARSRRGGRNWYHRALCGLVDRAVAGKSARLESGTLRVACNGSAVPLVPTDRADEYVGGVRFRAWRPASSLHPTIGVDAPLAFDLYDRWSRRAVAGCTYHVAHPGGRHYERFPVNSNEAESRRLARFFPFGHTPGPSPEPQPRTASRFSAHARFALDALS